MSLQNVQLVEDAYAAFAKQDMETLFSIFDPSIVFNLAENSPYYPGGPLEGQQQLVERLFSRVAGDNDDFRINVENIRDGGEMIVVQGRYTGRNRRTGLKLDAQMCHIWTVRNGRILRMDQYLDTLQSAEVFGRIARTATA